MIYYFEKIYKLNRIFWYMKKEKGPMNLPAVILSVLGIFVVALGVYVYFALNGTDYTSTYSQRLSNGTIIESYKGIPDE